MTRAMSLRDTLRDDSLGERCTLTGLVGYRNVAKAVDGGLEVGRLVEQLARWLGTIEGGGTAAQAYGSAPPFGLLNVLPAGALLGGPERGLLDEEDDEKIVEHWEWLLEIFTSAEVRAALMEVGG